MKKSLFVFICLLSFPSIIRAVETELSQPTPAFPLKTALDLDLDLGISLKKEDSLLNSRLRVGKFWMQDSDVLSAGLDLGKFSSFGLGGGAEGEWINLTSGLWIQGKLLTTQNEILVTGISVGWSLLGLEGLISPFNTQKVSVFAKVRLPIGLLIQ
ncbi:MAG: hypothetical protein EBR01_12115 [Proteobacteria bacterium]|nr:hypothetical protein [Pseudomonadota bacterium]